MIGRAALLLSLAAGSAHAANEWTVQTREDKSGVFASNINQSMEMLAETCDDGGDCFWMISMETACDKGNIYPVLVAGATASTPMEIVCVDTFKLLQKTMYRYAFRNFSSIDTVVRQRGMLGVAFALQSGQFSVMRFNNAEAPEKLDELLRQALARGKSSTKSQTL